MMKIQNRVCRKREKKKNLRDDKSIGPWNRHTTTLIFNNKDDSVVARAWFLPGLILKSTKKDPENVWLNQFLMEVLNGPL